jgi:mRNA interferase RelE/StbE
MAGYKIFFKKSVWKDFESIPEKELKRILQKIKPLSENPRPYGSQKLIGQEHFRIRHGCYHIIYLIQDEEVTVWFVKLGLRKDMYIGSEPTGELDPANCFELRTNYTQIKKGVSRDTPFIFPKSLLLKAFIVVGRQGIEPRTY